MALTTSTDLIGVTVVEKDKNGDVLVTWIYPSIDPDVRKVALACAQLESEVIPLQFIWTKYKTTWIYIFTAPNNSQEENNPLPKTVSVSLILQSKVFNPERYAALCKLLSDIYLKTGTPVKILEGYLSVFAKGKLEAGSFGSFNTADFDPRKSYFATPIKDIIKMFGLHIILLWCALIMKKRIVVYSDNLELLLKIIRGIPLFVWHRQDWEVLRPYVTMSTAQLEELSASGVYIAGFTDSSIKMKKEYYDLLIDVNARTITFPEHAAGDYKMGMFHKDLATFLVTNAENAQQTDQNIIKELALKTRDLLSKLALLKVKDEDGNEYITWENLQERKLPPNMDRFLFSIANAEGLARRSRS